MTFASDVWSVAVNKSTQSTKTTKYPVVTNLFKKKQKKRTTNLDMEGSRSPSPVEVNWQSGFVSL